MQTLTSLTTQLQTYTLDHSVFWNKTSCSHLEIDQQFRWTCPSIFRVEVGSKQGTGMTQLVSRVLPYYSTLKMEANCSSKMLLDFQWTTRSSTPGNRTLHMCLQMVVCITQNSTSNAGHPVTMILLLFMCGTVPCSAHTGHVAPMSTSECTTVSSKTHTSFFP